MKRDWDRIRDVLLEVEAIDPAAYEYPRYGPIRKCDDVTKASQAILLWKAGFIEGLDTSYVDLGEAVDVRGLTWKGHELLDTLRSKSVWERIKTTAKEKGIELTFD